MYESGQYTYQTGSHGKPTSFYYGGTYVRKRPPFPGRWCHFLVDSIDYREWTPQSLKDLLGDKKVWVARGVCEAVERFSHNKSYSWLFLMPILDWYVPRVAHPRKLLLVLEQI